MINPPPVRFGDRLWSPAELGAIAGGWWEHLGSAMPKPPAVVATVLPSHPEGIALFFALSALPGAVALLGEDPTGWRSGPPLPADTPIVLPPMLRHLADAAAAHGHRAVVLPEHAGSRPPGYRPFSLSGVIAFTTGSTGVPKPVFWSTSALLRASRAVTLGLGLVPGDGIVGALPLNHTHGFRAVLLGGVHLGGTLALVPRFDHRSVLELFASGEYRHFPCTPFMADLLARCPLPSAPKAPELIRTGTGRVSEQVFRTFAARFGVPVRQGYGATESGIIAQDAGPAEEVRWDTAGLPVPGVELSIGDDPAHPHPSGRIGRIWFRTDAHMDGYGFPHALEPREQRDGWFATADVGMLDRRGKLAVTGRIDDRFKTVAGQLVDPSVVADVLRQHPGVREVAVFPLDEASGIFIGALVEGEPAVEVEALRILTSQRLPPWARPHAIQVVGELPRNRAGRIDRDACAAIFARLAR